MDYNPRLLLVRVCEGSRRFTREVNLLTYFTKNITLEVHERHLTPRQWHVHPLCARKSDEPLHSLQLGPCAPRVRRVRGIREKACSGERAWFHCAARSR